MTRDAGLKGSGSRQELFKISSVNDENGTPKYILDANVDRGRIGPMEITELVDKTNGKNLLLKSNYSNLSVIQNNSKSGFGFSHGGGAPADVEAVEFGRIQFAEPEENTYYTMSCVAWIEPGTNSADIS
jgi:hypothetical protein